MKWFHDQTLLVRRTNPVGTFWAIGFLSLLSAISHAADLADGGAWKEVDPLLQKYCLDCHDSDTAKGDFDMEVLELDFLDASAAGHWIEVMDNLNSGEMPPEDKKQPTAEERSLMADWIANELEQARKAAISTGGRSLLRRLTRQEYENTVRDLLGVVFQPKKNPATLLPPDGSIEGFNKVSKALLLDPSLMDQYFEVARIVAERAVRLGDPPVPTVRQRLEMEEYDLGIHNQRPQALPRTKSVSPDGTGIITWDQGWRTFGELKHPYNDKMIPVSGRYAIRFRVGANPGADGEPVLFRVTRQGEGDLFYGKLEGTIENPQVIEVIAEMEEAGGGELGLNPVQRKMEPGTGNKYYQELNREGQEAATNGDLGRAGFIKARIRAEGLYGQSRPKPESREVGDEVPKTYLDWVEIEGPLYDKWPPESVENLFFDGISKAKETDAYLAAIIERILPLAYRRPVEQSEKDLVFAVAKSEWEASGDFGTGVKAALVTILCSPDFLYLLEPTRGDRRELSDYELASRLSYFFWSTMPDEVLMAEAKAGTLRKNLDSVVNRMLKDEKAGSLVEEFAAQWFRAKEFDRFAPDRGNYSAFYSDEFNGIKEDMNREPLEFFGEILRSDGDLRALIDSDWTMANERLAQWYDLPEGVARGDAFVKVALPAESPRGGLTGMAAFHKWGSDGSRTKPVERAKYVREVLFNDPPNPPPPNVGEVEPNVDGKKMTVRQRLAAHREIESCANCHSRLDPYGLALENFNVIGKWRDFQDGENQHWPQNDETRLDVSGMLPNGTGFSNLAEYKAGLRAMDKQFFRGFSEKLFVYAIGRVPEPVDRGVIDGMVDALNSSEGTFKSAVNALIESEAFLTK